MVSEDRVASSRAEERQSPDTCRSEPQPARSWWFTHVSRLSREPLLHFLLVGALIFAANAWVNPATNQVVDPNRIALTQDDLRQLAIQWIAQGRPQPNAAEMRDLVEQKVSEEILS